MTVSIRSVAVSLAVVLTAVCLISGATAAPVPGYERLSAEQLDELVGPIALYPDLLLAQMLPAATYPSELVAAAEWVKTKGGEGLDAQNWDDTVKSVARYPDILASMSENLEWTTALGQAFINQRADVMDSVQQLRFKAKSTGALTDTSQQKVVTEGEYLKIVPAEPTVIYVPTYDPNVVYVERERPWIEPVITFGAGLLLGSWLDNDWYWPSYGLWHGGNPYWNWGWSSNHYHGWGRRGSGHWPGYRYPIGGHRGFRRHAPGPRHGSHPSWAGGGRRGGFGRDGGRQTPTGFGGEGRGGRPGGGRPGVSGGPGGRPGGGRPGVSGGPAGGRTGGRERPGGAGTRTGPGAPGRPGGTMMRPLSPGDAGRQGTLRGGAFGDYGRGSTASRSGYRGRQSISGAGGAAPSPTGRSAFGRSGGGPSPGMQRPAQFGGPRGSTGGARSGAGGARTSPGGGSRGGASGARMGGGGGGGARMGGGGGGPRGGGGGGGGRGGGGRGGGGGRR